MRNATILAVSLFVVGLSLRASFAAPPPESGSSVSGAVTVDGEKIPLTHAYLDETDPEEPIVVLSDKSLPPDAIPFLSEKLVRESRLHAVAFSVSRKDGKLTNTYGKLFCPGHELGVGFARVEDGNVLLVTKRIDASGFEGRFMTPKPVKLSFVAYSFDLSFRISGSEPKRSR